MSSTQKTENKKQIQSPIWILTVIVLGILLLAGIGMLVLYNKQLKALEKKISQLSEVPISPEEITEVEEEVSLTPEIVPGEDWYEVLKIEGIESKKSDSFFIEKNQWRIDYRVDTSTEILKKGEYLFQIKVYKEGEEEPVAKIKPVTEVKPEEITAEREGPVGYAADFYIYEGDADFYLEIEAKGVTSWQIEIQTY